MKLDLRKDFDDIYAYVVRRAQNFDPSKNAGPGEANSPIAMIDLCFECAQAGWVALVFDTRPNAKPDGEWTNYIDENLFERPHWLEAIETLEAKSVDVVLSDGKQRKISPDTDFDEFVGLFGELLKGVLLKARADGVFKSLPKAVPCHMGVEELEGHFGWPEYENRGKEDLA